MANLKSKEILSRISPDDPQIFTFDSFAYLVVKLFAGELGYSRPEGTSGNEAYSQVRVINSVTNKKITAGLLNRDEIEGLNYKAFTSDEKVKGALSVALTTFATIKENRLDLQSMLLSICTRSMTSCSRSRAALPSRTCSRSASKSVSSTPTSSLHWASNT